MVKHGCEKKRDGKGQLGEEMLGKGRDPQRIAEMRRETQSNGKEMKRRVLRGIAKERRR